MGVQNGATGTSKLQNMSGKRWTFWGESILIGVWLMIMENQVRCHQRSAASVDSFLCLTFWYKACQTVQHLSFWMLVWLSDTTPVRLSNISVCNVHVVCVNVGASLRLMPVWQKKSACIVWRVQQASSLASLTDCFLWFTFWLWDVHFALHSEADRSWFGGFGLCWFIPCSAVECASQQLSGQACPVFRVSRTQSD